MLCFSLDLLASSVMCLVTSSAQFNVNFISLITGRFRFNSIPQMRFQHRPVFCINDFLFVRVSFSSVSFSCDYPPQKLIHCFCSYFFLKIFFLFSFFFTIQLFFSPFFSIFSFSLVIFFTIFFFHYSDFSFFFFFQFF